MKKPTVDITEAGGNKWTMGKLVQDMFEDKSPEQNRFLGAFNRVAPEGSDDDVLQVLLRYADLVFEGEVISSGEPATVEVVKEESTAVVIPDDPKKRSAEAVEYLAGIETLAVEDVGYQKYVSFLADVKAVLDAMEVKRKDLTKGARETVTKINAEFKPATDAYKKCEKLLKVKLIEFRADVESIRTRLLAAGADPPEPVPEVEGLMIKEKWDIRVVDVDAVPAEYFIPDMDAIEAAVKEGKTIPGVVGEKVETLAVEHKKVKR